MRRPLLFLIALQITIWALYYRSLDNPLLFDSAVTLDPFLYWPDFTPFTFNSLRYFTHTSFKTIAVLFGTGLGPQYACNIILHGLNAALFFFSSPGT